MILTSPLIRFIKNKELQFPFVIVLFYISESITKIGKLLHFDFYNYSALIKGVFCAIALLFSIFYFKKTKPNLLYIIISFFLLFIIGQYVFNDYEIGSNFFKNFIFFSRYIFVFIIIIYFHDILSKPLNNRAFLVFEYVIICNSILILLGFVFDVALFKTYAPNRFGYNGLFIVPSISTYFYALSLTYFSLIFYTEKKKLLQLILVVIVCFLVGTKALLLFLFLTGFHFFILKQIYKKKIFYIIISFLLILFYLLKDSLIGFFQKYFSVFFRLYDDYGLITMLTSYRDLNFKKNFIPLISEKWKGFNYILGGTDFEIYRVEFEIFDLILFWGLLGGIYYLIIYNKIVLKFNLLTLFGKVQMSFLLIIALLSGTFFNNGPLALYIIIVLNFLHFKTHEKWQ